MAEKMIKIRGSIKDPVKPLTKKQFEALQKKAKKAAASEKKKK